MSDHAIETHGLTRRFGAQLAVDGIDLRVPRGSFYGFLGENGAGKSTTISMLTGVLAPTSGEMRVLDQRVSLLEQQIQGMETTLTRLAEVKQFERELSSGQS